MKLASSRATSKHGLSVNSVITPRRLTRRLVTYATATSSSVGRLEELRQKRADAKAALVKIEQQIHAAANDQENTFMPNFGFIRQYSGDAYARMLVLGVPGNVLEMGGENLIREGREMLVSFGFNMPELLRGPVGAAPPLDSPEVKEIREKLSKLTLSNKAIWDRENQRPPIISPWVIKGPYLILCWVLDVLFDNRPIQRFWLLETVARMPYFSYISLLHLYETLGWWRRSYEARKVHFAEEWNEAHHLLIMEAMGGDVRWSDRFIGQHAACLYFIVLWFMWFLSPSLAYNFSELIEAHAVDTYGQFCDENEEILKTLPAPRAAKMYYENDDLYLYETMRTRLPKVHPVAINSLHDVFVNIREDEGEHVATMRQMQDMDILRRAPNFEAALAALGVAALFYSGSGVNVGASMEDAAAGAGSLLEGLGETITEVVNYILSFL